MFLIPRCLELIQNMGVKADLDLLNGMKELLMDLEKPSSLL
jgi:hypothetical protein